jgi:hypothetical protein
MKAEEMEARLKALETQVRTLQDSDDIKRLQRIYGYYVQHMMRDEIVDCFADHPDVAVHWLEGSWLGKEGVKRYFGVGSDRPEPPPGFLHQVMQLSGVVDVKPGGERARGRWYAFGGISMPGGDGKFRCSFASGIYEIEYIKENGKWKILTIRWIITYTINLPEGSWIAPEAIGESIMNFKAPGPDIPANTADPRFLSGYIFPFHYKHPVTGKETSETAKNSKLKSVKTGKPKA